MTFDELNLSKQADGLLPVIVQDAVTLKVLMLGYMNREAFDRSMAEGRVTARAVVCGPRARRAATTSR